MFDLNMKLVTPFLYWIYTLNVIKFTFNLSPFKSPHSGSKPTALNGLFNYLNKEPKDRPLRCRGQNLWTPETQLIYLLR